MKKVLFLTYSFSPWNRIASLRATAFSKYFPDNGWEPIVICEDWTSDLENFDTEMLQGLENITVHRLSTLRPLPFLCAQYYSIHSNRKNLYHWIKLASEVETLLGLVE